eukprot:scaffold136132_cov30-Tisochrysis_lutea.AAC.2
MGRRLLRKEIGRGLKRKLRVSKEHGGLSGRGRWTYGNGERTVEGSRERGRGGRRDVEKVRM